MRVYEENGRVLPIDPARVLTDLPVVDRPDTSILRLLADLRADYREVYNAISEVRLVDDNEIRIRLLELPVRALRGIGAERFGELSSVQRDLATRGITPVELDLRFKDQVIARLP
jgi:cell division protein FtsQ